MKHEYAPCSLDCLVEDLDKIQVKRYIRKLIATAKDKPEFKFNKKTRIEIRIMNEVA